MEIEIKEILNDKEKEEVLSLIRSQEYISIYQNPKWEDDIKHLNFILYEDGNCRSFCRVNLHILNKIKSIKYGRIIGGPVYEKVENAINLLEYIIEYFIKNGYFELQIQQIRIPHFEYLFIKNSLAKKFNVFTNPAVKNLSTLVIPIVEGNMAETTKSFSRGLKNNLKQSYKFDLEVKKIEEKDFENLAILFNRMEASRGIKMFDKESLIKQFYSIKENNLGIILGLYYENKLVSGGIFLIENKSLLYYIGCSDPELKKIPLQFRILYEAINYACSNSFKEFDMGGYSFFAKSGDQSHNINYFKYCFSQKIEFAPEGYTIEISSRKKRIHKVLTSIRKHI